MARHAATRSNGVVNGSAGSNGLSTVWHLKKKDAADAAAVTGDSVWKRKRKHRATAASRIASRVNGPINMAARLDAIARRRSE